MKKKRISSFEELDRISNSNMGNVIGGNTVERPTSDGEDLRYSNANQFKNVKLSPSPADKGIKGVWTF